jgi:hypothetical protein
MHAFSLQDHFNSKQNAPMSLWVCRILLTDKNWGQTAYLGIMELSGFTLGCLEVIVVVTWAQGSTLGWLWHCFSCFTASVECPYFPVCTSAEEIPEGLWVIPTGNPVAWLGEWTHLEDGGRGTWEKAQAQGNKGTGKSWASDTVHLILLWFTWNIWL